MDSITDDPPPAIAAELQAAGAALDQQIPAKAAANLLIATWNLRAFGSLTRKWTAADDDSPKRDLHGLRAIIEIIQRFDVIAVQEVKGDLRALRDMIRFLGDDWGFLMTDVTRGSAGNDERLAFLFDRRRLKPSGLAAEVVVPPEADFGRGRRCGAAPAVRPHALRGQLRHRLGRDLHPADRPHRLRRARPIGLRSSPVSPNGWRPGRRRPTAGTTICWSSATSTSIAAAASCGRPSPRPAWPSPKSCTPSRGPCSPIPRPPTPTSSTIRSPGSWAAGERLIDLTFESAGGFDFLPFFYRDAGLSKTSISWRISDHYPLWVQFRRLSARLAHPAAIR